VHYWLGNFCSIDERTVAAYKSVEAEGLLGNATMFREAQGRESEKFLSYFPNGITILNGGIDSGFNVQKATAKEPRLLQFKGRSVVQNTEVSAKATSLNHGDAFVLDLGAKVYVWQGKQANQMEKFAAGNYAETLKVENNAEIIPLKDEGCDEFWTALGGSLSDVMSAKDGGDDNAAIGKLILYKINEKQTGATIQYDKIAEGKDVKLQLYETGFAYLLDAGTALFVWIGNGANATAKRVSMSHAMKYMKQNNMLNSTPVEKIMEGQETPNFKIAMNIKK